MATDTPLANWLANKLFDYVKAGGTLASVAEVAKRKSVCEQCPSFGLVEPVPFLVVPGCKICGCPFATKGFMSTIFRLKSNVDEPLSIEELLRLRHAGIADEELVEQKITCPSSLGDLWA